MKLRWRNFRWGFLLLLALGSLWLGGCATDDLQSDNERPWDSPKGWENGLPSSMTEGR